MSCLITKDLAREGQRVLVYFFRHCNSATKRIMSRVQNHHAKNECAHCPGFSRKFFEIPPFSCRKKVIKSLIWQVWAQGLLSQLPCPSRRACAWRHHRQGPDGSCSVGPGQAGPEKFTLSCGILQARILEWVAVLQGIFLEPGIELQSPALQADSLPSELPGEP